jgi:hypothetical protein
VVFGEPVILMRDMHRRYASWDYDHLGGRKLLAAVKLGIDHERLSRWFANGDDSARVECSGAFVQIRPSRSPHDAESHASSDEDSNGAKIA